jgi:putative addiction module antidote
MTDDRKPKGLEEAQTPFRQDAPAAPKTKTLKVRKIGNSLGVILPKEALAKLRAGEGDELVWSETADGVALAPHDAEFERQVAAARKAMQRYRNALRELAK